MHKLKRHTEPDCLKNYQSPHNSWENVRSNCKRQIHDCLREMQREFCAYCEADISNQNNRHIEHFFTRAKSPDLTFSWNNLFWSCNNPDSCGKFKDRNIGSLQRTDVLIKPDEEDPANFFIFEATGEIALRKGISTEAKHRACETLRIFNLNGNNGLKTRRKAAANNYIKILMGLKNSDSSKHYSEISAYLEKGLQQAQEQEFYSTIRQVLT